MNAHAQLVNYVLQIIKTEGVNYGDMLALTRTGDETEIHHLPPGTLTHPHRLLDLIGTPEQALIAVVIDPGDLPPEIRTWSTTRTVLAGQRVWLHNPIITNLKRWWQLQAGQSALTGPGTPLSTG